MSTNYRMNWSYLAGFTDADGCIGCYERVREGHGNELIVVISWTQAKQYAVTIEAIFEFLLDEGIETSRIHGVSRDKAGGYKGQDLVRLVVRRQGDVLRALWRMEPYLVAKREKAQLTIAAIESKMRRVA